MNGSVVGYGEAERRYAEPFADALRDDPSFLQWVIQQTEFAQHAAGARLLHEEMKAHRSNIAQNWWRSHFNGSCRCFGCRGGKETDLLAIVENQISERFAIHFEIKHPKDRFPKNEDQGIAYVVRAQCWAARPPKKVLPHLRATTALLFSESNRTRDANHLPYFRTQLTFESVISLFPHATVQDVQLVK